MNSQELYDRLRAAYEAGGRAEVDDLTSFDEWLAGQEWAPVRLVDGVANWSNWDVKRPPIIPHGPPVVDFARTHKLPWLCRVRGHGWRANITGTGWHRKTCRRCRDLNVKVKQ